MSIDDVIKSLELSEVGSAELDVSCMIAMGEAREDLVALTCKYLGLPDGSWWSGRDEKLECCLNFYARAIIPRTRSLDATEKIKGEWTSMAQRSWPKHNGWTVGIDGSILKIRGDHRSLTIARTIAVLREFQRINFPLQDPLSADKEIQLKGNNDDN